MNDFGKRNVEFVRAEELLLAARYWAANTVIMPACDPWRSHLFCLVFAAIIAPTAADLEAWLRHAHAAVSGGSLATTCYAQARLELQSHNPPWFRESADVVPGMPTQAHHDKASSRELRMAELGRLLDEISADSALAIAPSGLIVM